MSPLAAFAPVLAAAVLGGSCAGLLGVLVVGLRMPFLAVCTAHAALAGAVLGHLVGLPPSLGGFIGALGSAVLLGHLLARRDLDPGAALGTLFTLMMGLAFLGLGLGEGPRSELLGLLWGSLLFVGPPQLLLMGVVSLALVGLLLLLDQPLRLLLFSRELAAVLLPERGLFLLVLVLSSAVVTVNLETVGGLMLYALIANPAVAALRLGRSYAAVLGLGAGFGAASAVAGFAVAYWLDLPVGACIVVVSSLLVGVTLWRSR